MAKLNKANDLTANRTLLDVSREIADCANILRMHVEDIAADGNTMSARCAVRRLDLALELAIPLRRKLSSLVSGESRYDVELGKVVPVIK